MERNNGPKQSAPMRDPQSAPTSGWRQRRNRVLASLSTPVIWPSLLLAGTRKRPGRNSGPSSLSVEWA
jgi:hypothetical protein